MENAYTKYWLTSCISGDDGKVRLTFATRDETIVLERYTVVMSRMIRTAHISISRDSPQCGHTYRTNSMFRRQCTLLVPGLRLSCCSKPPLLLCRRALRIHIQCWAIVTTRRKAVSPRIQPNAVPHIPMQAQAGLTNSAVTSSFAPQGPRSAETDG